MIVGLDGEVQGHEYRVALTPEGDRQLAGHATDPDTAEAKSLLPAA